MIRTVDLFAGPGGWDLGAKALGLDPHGIEWDDAACATRAAAGLRTTQGDVSKLDPADFAPCDLLIASPPCQAWSMAGKGGGRRDQDLCHRVARDLFDGRDTRDDAAARCEDARSILVVEPVRWALALSPRWIALEQVPPVLGFWRALADPLRALGYSVWTGVLSAEQYGVPQTRKRAILLADREGTVAPPEPTHHAYVAGEPRPEASLDLFGGGLLPWVSMAEALGWQEGESPALAPTVTGGGGEKGGVEVFASKASRARAKASVRTSFGEPHRGRAVGSPVPEFDPFARPSRTIVGKTGDWRVDGVAMRSHNQPNATVRYQDEPAPTIAAGHSTNSRVWLRASVGDGGYDKPRPRSGDEPAATVTEKHRSAAWLGEDETESIRVTVDEAAILQTFPAGYPWQGSNTKKYLQVGNAVPPRLAEHLLRALVGDALDARAAA